MKRLLLKMARWINKKYGLTVEMGDSFRFNSRLYNIVKVENKVEKDGLGELTMTCYDFTPMYNLKK